jgi:hypothetical protein
VLQFLHGLGVYSSEYLIDTSAHWEERSRIAMSHTRDVLEYPEYLSLRGQSWMGPASLIHLCVCVALYNSCAEIVEENDQIKSNVFHV